MFRVIPKGQSAPSEGVGVVNLQVDHWNDYSFVTMFHMSLRDETGTLRDIGAVKIGFKGQTISQATYQVVPSSFDGLGDAFFSLGQSTDFYKKLAELTPDLRQKVLVGLQDIVANPQIIDLIEDERVFGTSLLRMVSLSEIRGQFARVLSGLAELTNFSFSYIRTSEGRSEAEEFAFDVKAQSSPGTNIHALIGRNGVGKTTLLNGMIGAVTRAESDGRFVERGAWAQQGPISKDYFSSLVSVSFSAFDAFEPPPDQPDPAKGTCYFYVGLKARSGLHRSIEDIQKDCARYLSDCFSDAPRLRRWMRAIEKLGSDKNFASMDLSRLKHIYDDVRSGVDQSESDYFRAKYFDAVRGRLARMSSGHAIVLLTVTFLVAKVQEKTLVILDEPESHLHPPLLSAFIRSLSDLLHDRNGVAIMATHSPVVLQEIPRSCVWKVTRDGASMSISRPDIETFGENLGVLTSEVFNLEVERSGFHALLSDDVRAGMSFDEVMQKYSSQLGMEGRAILRALVASVRR